MLYLGSLLHVDVKTVAYFKHWWLFVSSALSSRIYIMTSIDFFFNGDARLGFGLLKNDIFRDKSQSVCL